MLNKTTDKYPLFVYGSLLKGFYNYDKYLQGKVTSSVEAKTSGKLFHLSHKGYPALIDGNDEVYGELIEIKDYEETLKQLDELEGFKGSNNIENDYNKVLKEVEVIDMSAEGGYLQSNKKLKAYVYMYNVNNPLQKEEINEKALYLPEGSWRRYMEER